MDYKLYHYKIDNFDDCGFGCLIETYKQYYRHIY